MEGIQVDHLQFVLENPLLILHMPGNSIYQNLLNEFQGLGDIKLSNL